MCENIQTTIMPGNGNYNIYLNDWLFHMGDIEELDTRISHFSYKAGGMFGNPFEAVNLFGGKYEWKNIKLPHDWLVDVPVDENANHENGFKVRGCAWYYKDIELDDTEIEDAHIVFEGILGQSQVYVNGTLAGRNFSGYNQFSLDIGDYLLPGEKNIIAVYVDARKWELWSYEGAGIYRDAYIEFRNKNRLFKEKCFLRSELIDGKWNVVIDLAIKDAVNVLVHTTIKDASGNTVTEKNTKELSFKVPMENPLLWSPESPYLYTATCDVYVDEKHTDSVSANIGFRSIEWTADEGMLLNGKHYPIKGICCHQDHAGVGAALTTEIMEYRLRILKSMGANAYRCAHNQPSKELLDLCDRTGLLVMSENRHFAVSDEVMKQIDSLVYISRNHPCVFMYGLYNEEPWHREKRGVHIAEKMRDRVRLLDTTRPVTGALDGGTLNEFNTASVLDVVGMNYFIKDYEQTHRLNPEKAIIGTENCPTLVTRGEYFSDPERQVFSNYLDVPVGFSENITETMEAMEKYPFVAGCFVWNGFDYRGECNTFNPDFPKKWPSVTCHWGFTDYCGIKKDSAYLLTAWYQDELMAHILPHWNWNKSDKVKVLAYTNGESAELFLNGKSLGKNIVHQRKSEWEVPFEPGILEVVVTRGNEKCTDVVKTADVAQKIELCDKTPFESDFHIVNVTVTDINGTTVPDFDGIIHFSSDNGEIVGVGNGNPNSHHKDNDKSIKLYHGCAQVLVRGKNLKARGENLTDSIINWK